MGSEIRVLIVDDTIFYRQLLSGLIKDIPDVVLAGVASNGKIAVDKIKLRPPDLVLLDMIMPEMDGLETLGQIKACCPQVDVVMVSAADRESAGLTMDALAAGALDFITKPRAESAEEAARILRKALIPILTLVRKQKTHRAGQAASQGEPMQPKPDLIFLDDGPPSKPGVDERNRILGTKKDLPQRIDVVALGVSTGGPNALKHLVPGFPQDFPVPILAVQHMPPSFTASLAESLDRVCRINVVEGVSEQVIQKGVMYIAPGGRHMVVRQCSGQGKIIGVTDGPAVHNCRPAVDVLFRSVAMVYGGNVLTVILTGMGNDGAAGVAAIRRRGGYSIVQDEKTSVVWGMPGAVVEQGMADEIVSLDRIAGRILEIVDKGRR